MVVERADCVHAVIQLTFVKKTVAVQVVTKIPFLNVAGHSLGRLLIGVRQPQRIHFRSKPDKLEDGLAGRLILKLAQDLFVDDGVVWVVDRIIAGVKVVGVDEHVGVDVGSCDLVAERVGVGEEEPRSVPVRRLHVSVVELIHEPLAEL